MRVTSAARRRLAEISVLKMVAKVKMRDGCKKLLAFLLHISIYTTFVILKMFCKN